MSETVKLKLGYLGAYKYEGLVENKGTYGHLFHEMAEAQG